MLIKIAHDVWVDPVLIGSLYLVVGKKIEVYVGHPPDPGFSYALFLSDEEKEDDGYAAFEALARQINDALKTP